MEDIACSMSPVDAITGKTRIEPEPELSWIRECAVAILALNIADFLDPAQRETVYQGRQLLISSMAATPFDLKGVPGV